MVEHCKCYELPIGFAILCALQVRFVIISEPHRESDVQFETGAMVSRV